MANVTLMNTGLEWLKKQVVKRAPYLGFSHSWAYRKDGFKLSHHFNVQFNFFWMCHSRVINNKKQQPA